MVRLVDIPLDAGDPGRAVADINEAITESRNAPTKQETSTKRESLDDPRFVGKSTAEIVEMYKNLESHSGRLANRLGQVENNYSNVQSQINQLILGKRENDLHAGSGEPVKIQPADLMVNPTDALDRYFESRRNPEVTTLKERLAQLEAQLHSSTFTMKHPNAEEITQDPAFAEWVRQTPLRQRLAQSAAQNHMGDADLLLQEWENAQKAGTNTVTQTGEKAKALARSVSLESGGTGTESGSRKTGKVFRRSDLIALRQADPDKYESQALQNEIVKAYLEGRVVD
jgi:hypothetical protein